MIYRMYYIYTLSGIILHSRFVLHCLFASKYDANKQCNRFIGGEVGVWWKFTGWVKSMINYLLLIKIYKVKKYLHFVPSMIKKCYLY